MKANFHKYQALGNDMMVIDPAEFDYPLTPATARLICHRHFGLGADGVCYGPLPEAGHPRALRFFNPDGSQAEKSGNGLRVFARYLWDRGYVSSRNFDIWMNGETATVEIGDDLARTMAMTIGRLSFLSADIPVSGPVREVVAEKMSFGSNEYSVTAVSVGNPHCVIFVDELSPELARRLGPLIETAPQFPRRTNAQLARALDQHTIQLEIWERGAGYTLASGTSASAAAGAAIKTGRCRSPVQVQMPGGAAHVAIDDNWQVTLTGSVEAVGHGEFAPDLTEKFQR